MGGGDSHKRARGKGPTSETELSFSLEDLYKGTTKNLKVTRKVLDHQTGQLRPQSEVLTINVQPGWKEGTKITFEGKGDESPGRHAGDLVFIIKQKPHPRFIREGDDLICTLPVALKDALTGVRADVPLLDGTTRRIDLPEGVRTQPTARRLAHG